MELRQLEHFVAVAEAGSFTQAARRMHIVQSGLSASIRTLERDLNVSLFVRSTRRVDLTDAGHALLLEARRTLAAARRAEEAVAEVQGLLRGTLTVGSVQQLPSGVNLPALISRFHADHPGANIHVRLGATDELFDEVRSGKLDVAFGGLIGPQPVGISAKLLGSDVLMLACASAHPLATRDQIALADLTAEAFVAAPYTHGLRQYLDEAFVALNVERRPAVEVNSLPMQLDLVAYGMGVALVPRQAGAYSALVRLVPLEPQVTVEYLAVTAAGRPPSAAARELLALALDSLSGAIPEAAAATASPGAEGYHA